MRTVSGATGTEIAKKETILGYLVEIVFPTYTGRYSSYGALTWNSLTFVGARLKVPTVDADAGTAQVQFFDPDAALRTIFLTDNGARNAPIKIWKAYINALGASDPMLVFSGVGDQTRIARGLIDVNVARKNAAVLYAPRKRLGPAVGCNFIAAAGTVLTWGNKAITLEPRHG
jgi:hypothetical protein